MNGRRQRWVIGVCGGVQFVLGGWLLLWLFLQPMRHMFFLWERISEMIVCGAFVPEKFNAYLVSQGLEATNLTTEYVLASPESRPGSYDVVADWLMPPFHTQIGTWPAAVVMLTGLVVMIAALRLGRRKRHPPRAGAAGE